MRDEDALALVATALRCREQAESGNYCVCAKPVLGEGLMCRACLLRNKDQERRRVDAMVRAHNHVPGSLDGLMCEICSMWEDDPRHHGVSAVGRCSWGEERRP